MSREVFIDSFNLLHNATSNTKLLDFQYRLLHNTITTNILLKKWGIKDDESCTFCKGPIETIDHLSINCLHSRCIWREMFHYISIHSGVYINLENAEILLGVREKPCDKFYNTICIITKQYIYACRCRNVKPTFTTLLEKIRFEKIVEHSISISNNKVTEWNKKWELLSHLVFSSQD